jgi:F420-non-reducing hydrogenase iron-sulfur subunit
MRFVQELLAFVGLGGRLHLEWISSAEAQKFAQTVTEFTAKIKALGPNPLNRFPYRSQVREPGRRHAPFAQEPAAESPPGLELPVVRPDTKGVSHAEHG